MAKDKIITCGTCKGKGEIPDKNDIFNIAWKTCPICGGKGKVRV